MSLRRVPWLDKVDVWLDMVDSAPVKRPLWEVRVVSAASSRVSKRRMVGSSIVYSFGSERVVTD